jgi:hypothetical protein
MCGRPLGCKRKIENSDNRVDCDHVSGLLARQHGRWPRWDPRSSPKQACGFVSRSPRRVLQIVGSTDGHLVQLSHPGIDAWFGRWPAAAVFPRHASSWPMPHGPSGCSFTAEAARRFNRLELGQVEFDNCPQGLRPPPSRGQALALSRWLSGNASNQAAYSACAATSTASASFQRRIRGRRSAGRRVRITGRPAARAARCRACRSASVMAVLPVDGRGMVSTPNRYVTKPARAGQAGRLLRASSSPSIGGPSCWPALLPRLCAACAAACPTTMRRCTDRPLARRS